MNRLSDMDQIYKILAFFAVLVVLYLLFGQNNYGTRREYYGANAWQCTNDNRNASDNRHVNVSTLESGQSYNLITEIIVELTSPSYKFPSGGNMTAKFGNASLVLTRVSDKQYRWSGRSIQKQPSPVSITFSGPAYWLTGSNVSYSFCSLYRSSNMFNITVR